MSEEELTRIAAELSGAVIRGKKFIGIRVGRELAPTACRRVAELPGLYHLTTITGVDLGGEIEVLYHFWKERRFTVVSTRVSKADPVLHTVSDILPSSVLYEAEVKDLLGVVFEGNPLMGRRLLLPDAYPTGAPPPLGREADPEKMRKMMELE